MLYLFSTTSKQVAQQFSDYIQVHYQQKLKLEQEHQTFHLYFINTETNSLLQAKIEQEAREFEQDPFNPRYSEASWERGTTQNLSAVWRPLFKINSNEINKLITSIITTKFTNLITLSCINIYLFTLTSFATTIFNNFRFPFSPLSSIALTQPWRYFSHALVHLSIWHILFNLTWWQVFAGMIEKRCGTIKLILIFLTTAILSGFAQFWDTGANFFGLSGVVYAVLGYTLLRSRFQPQQFPLPAGFGWFLLIGIATGFVSPYFGVYFGNAAHIAGLIIGLGFAGLDLLLAKAKQRHQN